MANDLAWAATTANIAADMAFKVGANAPGWVKIRARTAVQNYSEVPSELKIPAAIVFAWANGLKHAAVTAVVLGLQLLT
ncbi:hypothetical protein GCM10011297_13510 [Bacterioplanes sanyensis]|nr:hypothetical protein GCM10011297_13510 [Bacterioplanes sanyensis]